MHYKVSSPILFFKAPFSLNKHPDLAFWRGFWAMKGLGGRNVLLGFILGRKSLFSEQGKLQNEKKKK